jgi:hypothetical protein
MKILKSWFRGRGAVGATIGKIIFACVFCICFHLKICCTRRVQIYIEVSSSNAEMSFI